MNTNFLVFSLSLSSIFLMSANDDAFIKPTSEYRFYETQGVVWNAPSNKKIIALTFDDGPNPLYTPQILDLLKQYGAKSTFFVTGSQVRRLPKLATRQVKEGHELGNHTYAHGKIWDMKQEQIREELIKTEKTIVSVTGRKPPRLFRPPGGYIGLNVLSAAKQAGFTVVLWSFDQDTQDWKRPGARKIVRKVLKNVRKGDIVLFHDHGGDRRQTVRALKQILPALRQEGYQCVTVSELLQEKYIHDIRNLMFE